jgi:hypothetical protein
MRHKLMGLFNTIVNLTLTKGRETCPYYLVKGSENASQDHQKRLQNSWTSSRGSHIDLQALKAVMKLVQIYQKSEKAHTVIKSVCIKVNF